MEKIKINLNDFKTTEQFISKVRDLKSSDHCTVVINDDCSILSSCFKTIITPDEISPVELNPMDYNNEYFEFAYFLYVKFILANKSIRIYFNDSHEPRFEFDITADIFSDYE
mgnify:CR=1 FL=1